MLLGVTRYVGAAIKMRLKDGGQVAMNLPAERPRLLDAEAMSTTIIAVLRGERSVCSAARSRC
jgi:hypothetical protein